MFSKDRPQCWLENWWGQTRQQGDQLGGRAVLRGRQRGLGQGAGGDVVRPVL